MRHKLALLTTLIIVGCNPAAQVSGGNSSSSSNAVNEEAPYIWGDKLFPKTLQISSSFNAGEVAAMTQMGTAWKTAVNNKQFFDSTTPTNNTYNINAPDSVMGIYKATTWPSDISNDALGITQIFARRFNVGAADEYVSIVHADIILNYAPDRFGNAFRFDYDDANPDTSGFDLRSVVLHEMGHFLGIQHIPTWYNRPTNDPAATESTYKASSVMYPSINHLDNKRVPKTKDINALAFKYNVGGSAGSSAMVSEDALRYEPVAGDVGIETKIILELRKSGECIHRENGAVIRRHQVKL